MKRIIFNIIFSVAAVAASVYCIQETVPVGGSVTQAQVSSSKSALIRMAKLEEDADFVLLRNHDKMMLLHTELVPSSATKNATGIQIFTLKKNSEVTQVLTAAEFESEDKEYYRTRKVPSTGHFIREEDAEKNGLPGQMVLE